MKLLVVCSTSLPTPDYTAPLWSILALIWSLNSSLIFSVKMESFGWSMTFFKLSFKLRYEIWTQIFWSEISAFGLLSPFSRISTIEDGSWWRRLTEPSIISLQTSWISFQSYVSSSRVSAFSISARCSICWPFSTTATMVDSYANMKYL